LAEGARHPIVLVFFKTGYQSVDVAAE